MEKKKHNPNSHECLKRDTLNSWSELPLDLFNLVFERLSFANFHRAKTVCSSWYSSSKQCVPKNQVPWLILFPAYNKNNNNNSSCMLFKPEEKDKLYKTQDLGDEFAKSVCRATYGSWLVMQNPQYNLYVMNLFTGERIDLPSVESQLGMVKVERSQSTDMNVRSPVFWIDEKTKDYVFLWGILHWCVAYSKKGDKLWNQIPGISDCVHMVYKDHKLYFFSYRNIFTIIDFSGEIPQQTFQCDMPLVRNVFDIGPRNFVVTVTGDILQVEKLWSGTSQTYSFRVFKIYSSGVLEKHQLINSLGDESMLFDQGITVLANDTDGFIRNSIYFSDYGFRFNLKKKNTNDIFLFNLKTQKTKLLHTFDQFSRARWFLPS